MARSADNGSTTRRGPERRESTRHPIEIPIEVNIEREMLIFATTNLSRTGAFLQRAIPYAVGTRARLRILLPDDGPPISCTAEVATIPDATAVGMGLRFVDMDEQDQRRIEAFAAGVGV